MNHVNGEMDARLPLMTVDLEQLTALTIASCDEVILYLQNKRVLKEHAFHEIAQEIDNETKLKRLYSVLFRETTNGQEALIDFFREIGNLTAVSFLETNCSQSQPQSTNESSIAEEMPQTFTDILPETRAVAREVLEAIAGASDGGCVSRPSTDLVDSHGTIAEGGDEFLYSVKPAIDLKEGPHIYKMTSNPRGNCVIINNYEFDDPRVPDRLGSVNEADYLRKIYQQLGFRVIIHENKTAEKMIEVFLQLSRDHELSFHDALVVIILTHGERGLLMGKDGAFAGVETIVGMFNNYNCKQLLHKPKVFWIQACRGGAYDYGAVNPDSAADAVPGARNTASASDVNLLPSFTDMVIIYSTVDGYISLRNEVTGSWFGDAMGKVLVDHACDAELHVLLKRINNRIIKRESSDERAKQALEVVYRGWRKDFYFNPGIYEG